MKVLLIALALLLPQFAQAAIIEVATMQASGSYADVDSTASVAFPNNITIGNLLIVAGTNWNAATQTISISGCSTSWTVVHGSDFSGSGGVFKTFIGYGIAGSTGACTPTVDPGGIGNYGSYSLDSFTGVHATPLDVDGGTSTGTSTAASDSITTGTANALIIGVMTQSIGLTALTPGGSYTQFGEVEAVDNSPHNAVFRVATTATSYTVDWTLADSSPWAAQTVSFKESTGTPDTVPFYKRRAQ